MTAALETTGLSMHFGGLAAVDSVSLRAEAGARHALIGPNGAGKTTLINLLTGVLRPAAGCIRLHGQDITTSRPERRVKLGLVRTFQINQLFPELTPFETLLLAVTERRGTGGRWWRGMSADRDAVAEVDAAARQFRLYDVLHEPSSSLPYGKQRLLEIAIAIVCRPRLLLLDEPAAGVPEGERQELLKTIAALPGDVTVLLIEHDMDLVFRFASRITVLVNGAILTEGTPAAVARDPRVRAVYLGEGAHG